MKRNKMTREAIKIIRELGFEKIGTSFFTAGIGEEDNKKILEQLKPNHFTPNGNRSIFFGHMYPNTGVDAFWYATSDVRGTYRGYRCRTEYTSYDVGNIFASAKTCLECAEKFKNNYLTLEYNCR